MKNLAAALARRKTDHLYRQRRIVAGQQGAEITVAGQRVLSFCSNDYLGLANHPRIIKALKEGTELFGVGSGAAHLITGHTAAHHALEEALADFTGRPRALLFSTGYMANLGIVSALMGRHDTIFEDRYNHASLIDAAKLSGARLQRYPHGDPENITASLLETPHERMVATDGVFSMDGDIAPLRELATLCDKDTWLLVDDAHGLGVLGDQGRGSVNDAGLAHQENHILMGTLGKAFGTAGAFVAGSHDLIETLIQDARSYVYTTAAPPALAWATLEALRLVKEKEWRRERLRLLIKQFQTGARELDIPLMPSRTPIQPIVAGDTKTANTLSTALLTQDILVTAIRPPTVPKGTARLRVTFSANHEESHVRRLLGALEEFRHVLKDVPKT